MNFGFVAVFWLININGETCFAPKNHFDQIKYYAEFINTPYIARDNPIRALSFVEELYERAYSLKENPFRFQSFGGMRRIVHKNYIIVYRVNEKQKRVTIIYVTEGHRLLK